MTKIRKYFGPSGQEYLTADQPTRDLPKGCYDTVDGIYNPKCKFILSHNTCDNDVSIPTEDKIKWIKENCRKAWDEPTGYRPDLYENWNAGRRREPKYFDFTKNTTNLKQTDNYYHEIPYKDSNLYSFIKKGTERYIRDK
ncbi:MORN repeat-containing protein 5-like [Anoplophora glabripennis]|uniref:MORN repeat-containing protein 5-like n=1 Tax=Anoplophora glabripennis TaxID=217634 RepID=UPI000C7659A3|nr:MORN repeat-containing protein 5-like [Anoplophora glabripennis]